MTISRVGMRVATWDKSAKASSTKCESVIEYGTDTERRKGSVTVKAEDRPSGLAGDSASVITFLFRLQPGLVEWRVLVAAARSGAATSTRHGCKSLKFYQSVSCARLPLPCKMLFFMLY